MAYYQVPDKTEVYIQTDNVFLRDQYLLINHYLDIKGSVNWEYQDKNNIGGNCGCDEIKDLSMIKAEGWKLSFTLHFRSFDATIDPNPVYNNKCRDCKNELKKENNTNESLGFIKLQYLKQMRYSI